MLACVSTLVIGVRVGNVVWGASHEMRQWLNGFAKVFCKCATCLHEATWPRRASCTFGQGIWHAVHPAGAVDTLCLCCCVAGQSRFHSFSEIMLGVLRMRVKEWEEETTTDRGLLITVPLDNNSPDLIHQCYWGKQGQTVTISLSCGPAWLCNSPIPRSEALQQI
jgi:hypothetical protein